MLLHICLFVLLPEYSKNIKTKKKCVKITFLSYIFNHEVLDSREEAQTMRTAVNISHGESAFVSFSDQFDLWTFLKYMDNVCITSKLKTFITYVILIIFRQNLYFQYVYSLYALFVQQM
jgi:hypothetical protein